MSSQREVLIRILPITKEDVYWNKKSSIKMLKMALFDCAINATRLQCWRRTGHLPSFFVPTPGDLTAQESPPPEFAIQGKKQKGLMPGGRGELGAGGIDWCITGAEEKYGTNPMFVRQSTQNKNYWIKQN